MKETLNSEKEIIELERKILKERSAEFISNLRGMNLVELDKELVIKTKESHETQTAMNTNEKLDKVKKEKTELEAPYKDTLNSIKRHLRFVALLIKEKSSL